MSFTFKFYKLQYRAMCALRNRLDRDIAYARVRAGYKKGGRGKRPEPTVPVQP